MPLTPSQFMRQQFDAQDISIKTFSARSGLGLSHAYQLLRGERKSVSVETMDAIARGFGMSPAEAAAMMGRGPITTGHDELERIAIVRQVSEADWPAAKRMLLGLATPPQLANGHRDDAAKRRPGGRRALDKRSHVEDESPDQGGLRGVFALVSFALANCSNSLRRPLWQANPFRTAQVAH